MTPSLTRTLSQIRRAEPVRRYLFPALSTLMLVLLEPVLHAVAASPNAVPALGLCALIHWAGDRETRIPYWCAFILGLLADSLNGTPAGLYAAVFILAQAATRFLSYKLDIQHFNTRWLLAAAVILAAALVMSLGVAALSSVPRLPPSLWTYSLVTIAVYPLIAWILSLAADPRH